MQQKQNDTALVITEPPQRTPSVVSNVSRMTSASVASTKGTLPSATLSLVVVDPEQLETTENILREPSTVSQPGQYIERPAQQEHFPSITTSPAITGCISGADLDENTNGSYSESLSVVSLIPIDTAAPTFGEVDKRPFTKPAAAVFVRQQLPLEAVQEEQPPEQREPYPSTLQSCASCAADSVLDPPEQQQHTTIAVADRAVATRSSVELRPVDHWTGETGGACGEQCCCQSW
uniref:Uncharacterized protein n=1 Tax=Anopheles atroparvus TaxID=41427 RepID=A0A182IWB5_ANOAO